MQKFLIIQTAFIGDVILATAVAEKLHRFYPHAQVDMLVRKGNESLLHDHPFINSVLVWDKKNGKLKNLLDLLLRTRRENYDVVVNLHRFASSGFLTAFSGAKQKIGFDKNPFSFLFTKKLRHEIGTGKHEVLRNLELIGPLTDNSAEKPRLYPSEKDFEAVRQYTESTAAIPAFEYICIAPTSVWFTKQYPKEKWTELIKVIYDRYQYIYLLGAPSDSEACEAIMNDSGRSNVINLAGKLSFLESAALMKRASMNYVNDSAPLHIASAMDAPVTAVFCSTVPAFGFGPLSASSKIVETKGNLSCRPCGLHGHKACPEGHFTCAYGIKVEQLITDI